jgi:hypothetical protein
VLAAKKNNAIGIIELAKGPGPLPCRKGLKWGP